MKSKLILFVVFLSLFSVTFSQQSDEKAELILKKAIEKLGGVNYSNVKTIIGRGFLTQFREERPSSESNFLDILVFPNKERTEFKSSGEKTVQTNFDDKGWIFEGGTQTIRDQSKEEIAGFNQSLRTSVDFLLRRNWVGKAKLTYIGRREATLGKRNEVVKLTFEDDFFIEYEFSASENVPMKSMHKKKNAAGEETKEEDRYAQFVEFQGVFFPLVIDHFRNGKQTSRINYQSVEFNKSISDSIFSKPSNPKELKKDLKF